MDFRGRNIDLVGKQNLWFGISLALILIGLGSWAAFGLNLGIDFRGGGQFQYHIPYNKRPQAGQEVRLLEQARAALEAKGFRSVKPQVAGGNTLVINTPASSQSELQGQERRISEALTPLFKDGRDAQGQVDEMRVEGRQFVGPVVGKELKNNAVKGVLIGVALIALWIYIRYNFAGDGLRYAVAGIVALVHDVLVLIGLFALIGKIDPRVEIDAPFIAALLTVVGYSINDSVVIFDRLRENLKLRRKESFNKVVNDSLLETMSRSINTGMTVLIMLFALLWFGGESIYNFVLAMLVGIASGLYSSIFNASMVLTAWHASDERKRVQGRIGSSASRTAATTGAKNAAAANANRAPQSAKVGAAATSVPTPREAPRRSTFATAAPIGTSVAIPGSTATLSGVSTSATNGGATNGDVVLSSDAVLSSDHATTRLPDLSTENSLAAENATRSLSADATGANAFATSDTTAMDSDIDSSDIDSGDIATSSQASANRSAAVAARAASQKARSKRRF